MPEYYEGQLSKSGKYRMQGGQWVAVSGQAPAAEAQAAPGPPTPPFKPEMPGVEQAVRGGVDEATGPPTLGQKALGVGGKALGYGLKGLEHLNKPLDYATEHLIRKPLSKIPAFAHPTEVPFEATQDPMAMWSPAGQAGQGKGLSGETVTMPALADTTATLANFGLINPYFKGLGMLGRGAKLGGKAGLSALAKAPRRLVGEPGVPTISKWGEGAPGTYQGGVDLNVPSFMRGKLEGPPVSIQRGKWTYGPEGKLGEAEEAVAGAAAPAEAPTHIDPDVQTSAELLLKQLTGTAGVGAPKMETALDAAEPVAKGPWAKTISPAADQLRQARQQTGRQQYLENLPRFAAPGRAQTPALIPRNRWGTEAAMAQRSFDKMQRAMQELDQLKQVLGVQ